MRIRFPALFAFFFVAASTVASAQEPAGAGRMEVSAVPVGGTFFMKPAKTDQPDFRNYGLGAGFTYNVNRLVGLEGEVGGGLGLTHSFAMADSTVTKTLSPRTLAYEGNVVYHPRGNDHAVVPYVTAGVGGLTLFTRTALKEVGLANDETYLAGNVGTGIKWFAQSGWGVRGDYRFLMVKGRSDTSNFFGLDTNRYGHRVYGALLYTFGM